MTPSSNSSSSFPSFPSSSSLADSGGSGASLSGAGSLGSGSSGVEAGSSSSSSSTGDAQPDFAVNAAVVKEYLTALVRSGRLALFSDDPDAAPVEGQTHRSLARLLAELRAAAGGGAADPAPGATLARPLHVIVQGPREGGGGLWAAVQSFLAFCLTISALTFVWGVGAQAVRRYGGLPGSGGFGAPGAGAAVPSVAASSSPTSVFAAKEYSKVTGCR